MRNYSIDSESYEQLLKQASVLFATKGYYHTTIAEILTASNVSAQDFQRIFKTKDALFKYLVATFEADLLKVFNYWILQAIDQNWDTRQFYTYCLPKLFNYCAQQPYLTRIGFYESPSAQLLKDAIINVLTKSLVLNHTSSTSAETIQQVIFGGIDRLLFKYILTHEKSPENLTQEILDLYF